MSSEQKPGDTTGDSNDNGGSRSPSLSAKAVRYVQIAQKFQALGIERFDAKLPEGMIFWQDGDGRVVAEGRCEAILSYAGQNDSVMWAHVIPAFREAGVDCVEPPEGVSDYMEDITPEEAEQLANEAAGRVEADFYYSAPSGPEGVLYLAVFDFRTVDDD